MITPPTAPSPGKPVSAGFFSRLIACVKSGQLIEGPGYRLKRGPNGTSLDILPQRNAAKSANEDIGRFYIESILAEDKEHGHEEDPTTYKASFGNTYFDVGGRTYKLPERDSKIGALGAGSIIALRVAATGNEPHAELVKFQDFEKLKVEQGKYEYFTIPLYQIEVGGVVVCDFRVGPVMAMGEF